MGLVFLKSELLGLSTPLWSLPPGLPNQPVTLPRGGLAPLGPPGPGPQNQLIFGSVFRSIWEPQNDPQNA